MGQRALWGSGLSIDLKKNGQSTKNLKLLICIGLVCPFPSEFTGTELRQDHRFYPHLAPDERVVP